LYYTNKVPNFTAQSPSFYAFTIDIFRADFGDVEFTDKPLIANHVYRSLRPELPRAPTFPPPTTLPMMPDKRKASMSEPSNKRLRISNEDASDTGSSTSTQERPRNNPIYGQKSAFPGLDDGGDELFYGSADDGMEYLRMVR
jgi:hypothetical protein